MTRIAVLTIGSELLDGRVSDTNTATIGDLLHRAGLKLRESRCVSDTPQDIILQLRELASANDVLLVSGGLGPTNDDLTAAAAAQAFNLPLLQNPDAETLIEAFFTRTRRPMHTSNRKQALLPASATPVINASGSAPGFTLNQSGCQLYFMPGVPREMTVMLQEEVLPLLRKSIPSPALSRKTLKILGIAEAHLQEKLRDVAFPDDLEPTFTLDYPLVLLTFEASGEASELLEESAVLVRNLLGDAVVAEDQESLPEVVAGLLTARGATLSIAESCTGGLLAKLLTDIPGASRFLERTAVTYANSAKTDWLKVDPDLLEQHGAVSAEVAEAMAEGMRHAANSDYALSTTGIAGPDGGTAEKPVGTVYVALATANGANAILLQLQGDRRHIRRAAAFRTLDMLRRELYRDQ